MPNRIAISLLLGLVTFSVGAEINTAEWTLVKDENNIQVYTQEVGDSDIVRAKAIAIIPAPLHELKAILDDYNHRQEWIPYLRKSSLLKINDENSRIEYSHFYAPWPVSDRDFVYNVRIQTRTSTEIQYEMRSIESEMMPEQKDRIRAELIHGRYRLEQISESETRVEVLYHADPGGWLPGWLVNRIQRALPYRILLNLGEKVQRPGAVSKQ